MLFLLLVLFLWELKNYIQCKTDFFAISGITEETCSFTDIGIRQAIVTIMWISYSHWPCLNQITWKASIHLLHNNCISNNMAWEGSLLFWTWPHIVSSSLCMIESCIILHHMRIWIFETLITRCFTLQPLNCHSPVTQ